jgi:RHS repeat-associated protein
MPGEYSEVADSTQVRRFFGNKHGTLDKWVEGGAVTTATYRDDGHILSRTDPMGATTIFERDERGRLLKVTDPLGRVTAVERDGHGLPVLLVDPAGGVTRIERDPRGNAIFTSDATGAVSVYRYDDRGLLTEAISPTGAHWVYAYDAQRNLIAVTMPSGGVWRFLYDALGRLLARTDPLGAETRYFYSDRGDLLAIRDATGAVTRYAYDGEGHLTQMVDPKGHFTEFVWGGYHKLCERKDANGNIVRLRYNLEGELVEVHNERGEVHKLKYSTSGLLLGETTFDGRELRYKHDLAGRVVRFENGAREVTAIEYDLAGQLVRRELQDGSAEEFRYDILGHLIVATNPTGELRFERDALGRVVREVQTVAGTQHWIEVTYDAAGDRIGRRTSLGHTETVTRGVLGERTRTILDNSYVVEHRTDLLGRETARVLPGGGWLQSQYDAMGRVARRRASSAGAEPRVRDGEPEWLGARPERISVDKAYQYDASGELTNAWDMARGAMQYTYDPVGQLLAAVSENARAEVFAYDATGNVYERDEKEKCEYGNGNRLLRKGTTEYEWDDDGRLVAKRVGQEVTEFSWNGAGLLQSVTLPDGRQVAFKYDTFARRVGKYVSRPQKDGMLAVESQTHFWWDGDVLVHAIRERAREGGDPIVEERSYAFEDDSFVPLAHRDGAIRSEWFSYVNDPIGTPERLLDARGEIACELTRSAWGVTQVEPKAQTRTEVRFQGQWEDEETGLAYTRTRYYDAETKRFISSDIIGLQGGLNLFAWALNPIRFGDPLGLQGRVMLDTNALVALMDQKANRGAILRAIGDRRPVVPKTVLREFAAGGGDAKAARRCLARRGGGVVADVKPSIVAAQPQPPPPQVPLARNDATIVATARQQNMPLLTRDDEVLKKAPDVAREF